MAGKSFLNIGKFSREIRNILKQNAKALILILLALGVLLFMKKLLVMAIFLGINVVVSFVWMYFHNRSIAIEFIGLTSLICLYAYGVKTAMFMMFVSVILHNFITTNMSIHNVLTIVIAPLLLWAMSPFTGIGIVAFAVYYTIIYNLIFWIFTIFLHTGRIHKRLIFTVTHIAWTVFLFTNFAEPLLKLFV